MNLLTMFFFYLMQTSLDDQPCRLDSSNQVLNAH